MVLLNLNLGLLVAATLSQATQVAAVHLRRNATTQSCASAACAALYSALPSQVAYSASSTYTYENTKYWSEPQAEVHPTCFVSPRDTAEVATVMQLVTANSAPFTVKGGGHSGFAGASSVAGGVTIDLRELTTISVAADNTSVSLGAGLRWVNVSTALDPLGLAVVGGRTGDVGVSGLILGGGISWFGKYGWACDNVLNYEVVLASGEVVDASPTSNEGLYWALRGGGGSNFGIVTRFDVKAFAQGDLWNDKIVYTGALNTTLTAPYINLTVHGLPADTDAHTFLVNTYIESLGGYAIALYEYTATLPKTNTTPSVFQPFEALPTSSVIYSQTTTGSITAMGEAIDEPYGDRHTWVNTAVKLTDATADLLLAVYPLWETYVTDMIAEAAKVNDTGFVPYMPFQAISQNIVEGMQAHGGNALGITEPLMIVQLTTTWTSPDLDDKIESASKVFIDGVNALAEAAGLYDGFVYMNYAGSTQQVQKGYGADNYAKLEQERAIWDPENLLQSLWTGYFKL